MLRLILISLILTSHANNELHELLNSFHNYCNEHYYDDHMNIIKYIRNINHISNNNLMIGFEYCYVKRDWFVESNNLCEQDEINFIFYGLDVKKIIQNDTVLLDTITYLKNIDI